MIAELDLCSFAELSLDVQQPLKDGSYLQASRCKQPVEKKATSPLASTFEASFLEEAVGGLNQNIVRKYLRV